MNLREVLPIYTAMDHLVHHQQSSLEHSGAGGVSAWVWQAPPKPLVINLNISVKLKRSINPSAQPASNKQPQGGMCKGKQRHSQQSVLCSMCPSSRRTQSPFVSLSAFKLPLREVTIWQTRMTWATDTPLYVTTCNMLVLFFQGFPGILDRQMIQQRAAFRAAWNKVLGAKTNQKRKQWAIRKTVRWR